MKKTLLFVYGTLKRGQQSHHLIAQQEFVADAKTMSLYRLHSIGWHPALVLDLENGLEICGELWSVDAACLAQLDAYEGVPKTFLREDVAVRDTFQTVQAYFYNLPLPPGALSGNEWPFPT